MVQSLVAEEQQTKLLELQNSIADLATTQRGLGNESKAPDKARNPFLELFKLPQDDTAVFQDEHVGLVNPCVPRTSTTPADKPIGDQDSDPIDPQVMPAADDQLKRQKSSREISPNSQSVLKSATTESVLVEIYVGSIASCHQAALLLVIHDVAYAKWAEEQLLTLKPNQASLGESTIVWGDVVNRNANVVFWNRMAHKVSGLTMEKVIGHQAIWALLYPDEGYRASIILKQRAGGNPYVAHSFERCPTSDPQNADFATQ
jgi:hypothetical protein